MILLAAVSATSPAFAHILHNVKCSGHHESHDAKAHSHAAAVVQHDAHLQLSAFSPSEEAASQAQRDASLPASEAPPCDCLCIGHALPPACPFDGGACSFGSPVARSDDRGYASHVQDVNTPPIIASL
jgi:hypothetical protein